jgi:Terminase large subunit, T4likevirus-type, N-terminal
MNLSQSEITTLNDFANFVRYKKTWDFGKFINTPAKIIGLFTGNQRGKTAMAAYGYVMRILSIHPVAIKNVEYWECENHLLFKTDEMDEEEYLKKHRKILVGGGVVYDGAWNSLNIPESCPHCGGKVLKHRRESRVFRFCSETLPGQSGKTEVDGGSAEVKNTQYPEFKKWLPKFLIKKDITFRNPAMVIKNIHGDEDIVVEFVSYNQSVQSTAGTQRLSIWTDEEPDQDFMSEQRPRLLAENGDWIITLTPANHITWIYDDVFEKAKVYYRTKAICDYLKTENDEVSQIEKTQSDKSIAIIQAASDDNPTLNRESLESLFNEIADPDEMAIRRYGIFKQVSGRIFKDFEFKTHYIDGEKFFPDGVPGQWTHARGIDYHPQTPWAFGAIALSPTNEAFIYAELNPSPEKFTTREIATKIGHLSKMTKFHFDLVDPLIKATKLGTKTVLDDLNDTLFEMKKEGICMGGYFESWDTKGEKGRDEIKKRLKNAKKVGRPFNNAVIEKGQKVYLPTLWILSGCKLSAQSMRQWRWSEYSDMRMAAQKGEKNTPEQKWSHFNMVWEAIFKDPRFKMRPSQRRDEQTLRYFQGA